MSERTFVMIKPDAFQRGLVGEVLDLVSQRGLKLIGCKTVEMTPEDCRQHYSHHVEKDFYPELVEFMTSGPSLALLFEGPNACSLIRQLIGDSKHPSQVQPGSIRGRYAMDFPHNLIHGSKTYDEALHEYRLYLEHGDIFDEHRVANIQAEFEEKRQRELADLRARIKKDIQLGDEVFAPDVLQPGDWVTSRKGISLITEAKRMSKKIVLEREDYFHHWWKQRHSLTFVPEKHTSSMEFTWTGSPLFLVGRDGIFLDNFKSEPIVDDKGGKYIFKAGRFLPIFKKKSTPNYGSGLTPFVSEYKDANGYHISDIYDPVHQIVMKVVSKDDPVKWRMIIGNEEISPTKQQSLIGLGTFEAQELLKVWGKKFNSGGLSVLLRYGLPFNATYGDGKIIDLKVL